MNRFELDNFGIAGEGGTGQGASSTRGVQQQSAGPGFGGGGGPGALIPSQRGRVERLQTRVGVARTPAPKPKPVTRPLCAIEQCQEHIESAWFSWIEVAAPQIGANDSAWYGLRKFNPRQRFAQELRVLGCHYHILPSDVAGVGLSGMGSPLAWGDATGMSAAIVIGVNLPISVGEWSSAPAYIAGLNHAAGTPQIQRNSGRITGAAADTPQPRLLLPAIRFPTGQFSDVTPNIAAGDISLQGDCSPVLANETIGVALVVGRSFVHNLNGQLAGCAQIDLVLGHTINDRPWTL